MRTDQHILGDYELIERIGQGGMAEVYYARHLTDPSQEVALKVIRAPLAEDQVMRRRFLREVRALSRLSHPHILSLLAWGEEEDKLYLVLPWVRDGTLSHLLQTRGGSLPVEEALPLFGQLCAAVQHAHEHGIIHRDIKPQNVLVHQGTHIFLTDFGIAQSCQDSRLTLTGVGMGSVHYMAPEQALGQATIQSDLYSLGIVLYQLLTGNVPFSGVSPLQVVLQQAHAPLPDPRQFQPILPPRLIQTLQTALAPEPAARFESVQALWQAIQPLEAGVSQLEASASSPLAARPGSRPLTAARPGLSEWLSDPKGARLEMDPKDTQDSFSKRATLQFIPAHQKKRFALGRHPEQQTRVSRYRPRLSMPQRVFLGGAMTAAFVLLVGSAALGFSQPPLLTQDTSGASQVAPQPTATRTPSPAVSPTSPPQSTKPKPPHPPAPPGKGDDGDKGKGHGKGKGEGGKGHGKGKGSGGGGEGNQGYQYPLMF